MKKLSLNILDVQLLPNGEAVIITKIGANNPSKNGVHKLKAGQFRRVVERCLGVFNPIGFKHIVSSANGAAKLTIDMVECKAGEAWENVATGEKGVYTKDWIKYSNHSCELGVFATMKLAEMSLNASFQQAAMDYAYATPQRVAIPVTVAETTVTEGSADSIDANEEQNNAPTV